MQMWSVSYLLHFESVKIHKHCLKCKVFSTDVYKKNFNCLLLFQPLFWSVNCTNWFFELCKIFQRCREVLALIYIWDLAVLLFMESSKFVPSQIFFWSINCTDLVYKLGITFRKWTKIAYIGMDLVLTYIERLFSTVYYFSSYFHWSISCVRARKFHSFFLTRSETEARFKFEGF